MLKEVPLAIVPLAIVLLACTAVGRFFSGMNALRPDAADRFDGEFDDAFRREVVPC